MVEPKKEQIGQEMEQVKVMVVDRMSWWSRRRSRLVRRWSR